MSPDGEAGPETAIARAPASMAEALSSRLPDGSDPDEVRDWFEFETIVDLPAPALTFAEAAAADYRRISLKKLDRGGLRCALAVTSPIRARVPARRQAAVFGRHG